jgi:hypothetical protein
MASLELTYDDLRDEIAFAAGYPRAAASRSTDQEAVVAQALKAGLRRFYSPPPLPNDRYSHEWSFLRPLATLTTTTAYTTGTVTIVNGVVTLAGGTFPTWAAQGELTIAGTLYPVSTRDSNTQITLIDTTLDADAGTSYSLRQTAYDLPSDFAMLDGHMTFAPGSSVLYAPIEIVGENQVRARLACRESAGRPEIAAIRPKTMDYTVGTRYEILLEPRADTAYTIHYRYRVNVNALDGTNDYPPGGSIHSQTVLAACLSELERIVNDTEGVHTKRFWENLAASVSQDRRLNSPQSLGVNRDYSDSTLPLDNWHMMSAGIVTYNGNSY